MRDAPYPRDAAWRSINHPSRAERRTLNYFFGVVANHHGSDCLIWPYSRNEKGYGVVVFEGADRSVHRMACIERHGPPPTPEHHAAHSCGNGHLGCVNPEHVRWATPKENNADKIWHGTNSRKLRPREVLEIRRLKGRMTAAEIGRRYGISKGAARAIYNRKSWSKLP